MAKPFKLSEITAMKLECMKYVNNEIKIARKAGHEDDALDCERELKRLQHEVMHPGEILDEIQKFLPEDKRSYSQGLKKL